MSLLAPASLALLGLLPVIVLLYFLKLKRREEPIASTYLWRRAIEDMRVNALFQRLRQNLLLWLQLLLLVLLVMALARPAMRVRRREGRRYICLIDTSASMSARDVTPSRLAAAKHQALELVANMRRFDRMMLMTFDVKPAVLVPFTNAKSQLRAAIEGIRTRETSTDLSQAVDLIAALGPEVHGAHLYLLSDGNFDTRTVSEAPGVEFHYVRIGEGRENLGITALDARRSIEYWGQPQTFVRLQNFGSMDANTRLELYLDGELFDARSVKVPTGESAAVVFSDPGLPAGLVRVVLAEDDDLAADNTAWLSLTAPRQVQTLIVSPGNYFLELAIRKDPLCAPVFMSPEDFDAGVTSGHLVLSDFDLVIFERHAPASLTPGAYLFLGAVPPIEGFSTTGEVKEPVVVDWDDVHPINQYVTYANLVLESSLGLVGPPDAHTRVDSDAGPIILWWSSAPGYRLVVVGFDLFASRWPLRTSFPVFLANAVRHLGGVSLGGGESRVRPGTAISLTAPPGVAEVAVTYPTGEKAAIPVRSGRVTFGDTYACGPYTFALGEGKQQTRVVNLLDKQESDIAPSETVSWQKRQVTGTAVVAKENREFWPWLTLLALTALMTEWYIYNRRVYV